MARFSFGRRHGRTAFTPRVEVMERRQLLATNTAIGNASILARSISEGGLDARSHPILFRPSTGEYLSLSIDGQLVAQQFGAPGDIPLAADFDGDGKNDLALYRPGNCTFYALRSDGGMIVQQMGIPGDLPLNSDFDGDGRTDIGVFRPSNATWYVLLSGGGALVQQFGAPGDIPLTGDFFGDSKDDLAVFRPSNATFYVLELDAAGQPANALIQQFGAVGDVPVPADYFGDGKSDPAVYRPSSSTFYVLHVDRAGHVDDALMQQFGTSGDIPVPADYGGTGRDDWAVFRPSNATLYALVQDGHGGFSNAIVQGVGATGDIPLGAPFLYRGQGELDFAEMSLLIGAGVVPGPAQGWYDPSAGGAAVPVPSPLPFMPAEHQQYVAEARAGGANVVFLGDSITKRFGDDTDPSEPGIAAWDTAIAPLGAENYGLAGDQAQNLLWRVVNGELAGQPRVAVVMIGSNNLRPLGSSPEQAAAGITAVVAEIRALAPRTKILLMGVLPKGPSPSDPLRAEVQQVNRMISGLADDQHVWYLDIGPEFVQPDGTVSPTILSDGTHPTAAGYQIWADAIAGELQQLLALPVD
jgi:lysophospholipase L1-like esterase